MRFKKLDEFIAIFLRLQGSQINLPCAEDTRRPALGKHDLDTRGDVGLKLGLDSLLLKVPLEGYTGDIEGILECR
jgi:hypothetical protein